MKRNSLIAVVVSLTCFGLGIWRYGREEGKATSGQIGFPLDDSWIHLQIARNVAQGDGFSYNPGEPTPASTAPLWSLLLAGLRACGADLPASAKALGVLLAGSALVILVLGLLREGWTLGASASVGVLVAASFPLLWGALSGLEIPLVIFLLAWGVVSLRVPLSGARPGDQEKRSAWRWGGLLVPFLLLALASQARPEAGLLFLIAWLAFVLQRLSRDGKASASVLILPLLLLAGVALPYVVFCLKTTGRLLPDTFYAKIGPSRLSWPNASYFIMASTVFWREHLLLGFLYPLGLLSLAKSFKSRGPLTQLAGLWTLGLPLGYSLLDRNVHFMSVGIFGRYLFPTYPFFVIVAIEGCRFALEFLGKKRYEAHVLACLILFQVPRFIGSGPSFYGRNVWDIQRMQVAMGQWVKDTTPPEALIATNDIGAIAYLGERRILDLAGIANPEISRLLADARPEEGPFGEDTVIRYLDAKSPDLLIIFPNWYPRLASSEAYVEVKRIETQDTITSGGPVLVALKPKGEFR